jgi:hypothetical protein
MSDAARLPAAPAERSWEQRLARAWSAGALPAVLLPMIAIALGPQGLAVLGPGVVSLLDPAVPVALATIGAMAALQLSTLGVSRTRITIAFSTESALTGVAVAAGLYSLGPIIGGLSGPTLLVVAAAAGICAAASSPLASAEPTRSARAELVVRDADFLLPAIVGALLVTWLQQPTPIEAALLFGKSIGASILVALAGVLLASSTGAPGEQRVLGMAVVLLLGGVADTLGLSALLSGLCAGLVWRAAGAAVREAVTPVLSYVQHPLLVILLLVAGMRVQITPTLLALTAAYVLLRLAGKVVGSGVAAGMTRRPVATLAAQLVAPGVMGIALALTFARGDAELASTIVTVVVLGTAAAQLLHAVAVPGSVEGGTEVPSLRKGELHEGER